jgi:hypothetical protein
LRFKATTHFFAALNFAHLALAAAPSAALPAALNFPPAFLTGLTAATGLALTALALAQRSF